MSEESVQAEQDNKSPDFRPWGENFPTREEFSRYFRMRHDLELQNPPPEKTKPDLLSINSTDIAKFWNINWSHIVGSRREGKTPGSIPSTIDYLYEMLRFMSDTSNPFRQQITNDPFYIRPTGAVYYGKHRTAALILIGPQFIQRHELQGIIKPEITTQI